MRYRRNVFGTDNGIFGRQRVLDCLCDPEGIIYGLLGVMSKGARDTNDEFSNIKCVSRTV